MGKYDSVLEQITGKRADSAEQRNDTVTLNTAFLSQELEALEAEFHKVLHTPMQFRRAVPVRNSGFPAGCREIGYKVIDYFGEAKFISNAADDLPLVNVAVGKETQNVHNVGAAYMVTLPELQAASMANLALEREDAVAAATAIERKLDKACAIGEPGLGFSGLLNQSTPTINTPAANGLSSGTSWASKLALTDNSGPVKIIADLCALLSNIVSTSKGQILPDRLVVDYSVMALLESNMFAPAGYSTKNILQAFLESQPYIKSPDQVIAWDYARTASSTGGSRIAAFKADPMFLQFAIPMEADALAPQFKNLAVVVNMYGRVAGLQLKQSLALQYLDGTIAAP